MNGSMGEKIFFYKNPLIPLWREIWSGSNGSHPEEKPDQGATDPTPKRNPVKEPWIPPRRNFRVGKQNGEKNVELTSTKKGDLGF